jgi:phosphopantetheine adenylyltransferase
MTQLPSSSPSSLLLLPSPPQPPTPKAIHAAYHAPLSAAISRLSSSSPSPTPRLAVAVVSSFQKPSWSQLQSLLARLYSLVAAVLPDDDTTDVRIVLVDHVQGRDYTGSSSPYSPDPTRTIPDLSGLAGQQPSQQWSEILHPGSEAGYSLLKAFLAVAEDAHRVTYLHKQLVSVPGGLTLITPSPSQVSGDTPSGQRYKTVCLGGTFDHLHPGHKLLLHAAALLLSLPSQSDTSNPAIFIIGISGDALLKNKKFATELEPWPARTASVLSYLSSIIPASQIPSDTGHVPDNEEIRAQFFDGRLVVRCVNIPDGYGPTITEEDINAIVLSGETRSGGASINDKRGEKGWKKLDVYEIDVLQPYRDEEEGEGADGVRDPEDFSAKISSTEIRRRRAEARES